MADRLTERISVAIAKDLQEAIRNEARRRHRNYSDTVRTLLLEALGMQTPPIIPDDGREEFEISLTPKEAAKLEGLGYDIATFHPETMYQPELF